MCMHQQFNQRLIQLSLAIVFALGFDLQQSVAQPAAQGTANESSTGPNFFVIELASDLGTGEPQILKWFLASAAKELLQIAPNRKIGNITVLASTDGYPRTLYDKSFNGNTQILLNPAGRSCCSYVTQFSHELAHVLCNYELKNSGDKQWFEETLCETASLFTSKRVFQSLCRPANRSGSNTEWNRKCG